MRHRPHMVVKLTVGGNALWVVAVRSMRDDDSYDVVFKAGTRAECEDYAREVDLRQTMLALAGRG